MMDDKELRLLIGEVQTLVTIEYLYEERSTEKIKKKRLLMKKIDMLTLQILELPGLARIPKNRNDIQPDYEELLYDTLIEVPAKIKDFKPQPHRDSIKKSLEVWINEKLRLKYKVKELCFSSCERKSNKLPVAKKNLRQEYNEQARKTPLSLDSPLNNDNNKSIADLLPIKASYSIWELDNWSNYIHQYEFEESVGYRLLKYIQQDSENKLRDCYLHKYQNCNAQKVSLMLYSESYYKPNGLPNLSAIAKKFEIPYKAFYSYWRDKYQPLLIEIAKNIGYVKSKGL